MPRRPPSVAPALLLLLTEAYAMNWLVLSLALVAAVGGRVDAQDRPAAGVNREQGVPGSAGPKSDGVVQRGQQPNPAEVRPGNRDGDAPSASAGQVVERPAQRIFGLPVTAALLIGGALVALLIVAGLIIPSARRRERPQGGGTYGRP